MNSGNTLVTVIILVVCMIPFVSMYYNRIKKQKKKLQALKGIAQQQNCDISQYEFCGDFVFGIDETKDFVFFYKQKKEEIISQFVDLSKVQICQAIKQTKALQSNTGSRMVTALVQLSFSPMGKDGGDIKFELYDDDVNMQLSGELPFVDKWSKQINGRLKNKKQ